MDPADQNHPSHPQDHARQVPRYGHPNGNGPPTEIYKPEIQNGGVDYPSKLQEQLGEGLEGHLRNMILHNNTSVPPPHPPLMPMSMPIPIEANENGLLRSPHPPFPPHMQPGYPPMPPMYLPPGPPGPGLYPPNMMVYPIPFDGQLLPFPASQPFPMGQYPPPRYAPVLPDQVTGESFVHVTHPEPQAGIVPAAPVPRQFERNAGHHRNLSYPRPHQKYPTPHHRQFDQGPPRFNGHSFQRRQQPPPGLIDDDFPPLGTERPKSKMDAPLANPEEPFPPPPMNYAPGPPTGPRYRGSRNFVPRPHHHNQQQPYQPSAQELAVLNEVAKEQIEWATPPVEELDYKKKLHEKLQNICTSISPTAELKAFGSLVCGSSIIQTFEIL